MAKIKCNNCGAQVNAPICEYCKQKVENEYLIAYQELIKRKTDEMPYIKEKIAKLKKLTPEENQMLLSFYENELVSDNEIDFIPIISCTMFKRNIVDHDVFKWVLQRECERTIKEQKKEYNVNEKDTIFYFFVSGKSLSFDAYVCGYNNFHFSKNTVDLLYEGNIAALTCYFHEMFHSNFYMQMISGVANEEIVTMIKERIIRGNIVDFYKNNYKDNFEEICAQQAASKYACELLDSWGYFDSLKDVIEGKATKEEMKEKALEILTSAYSQDLNNRNRIVIVNGKEEIKTVDEIFDEVIQNMPNVINVFPQLGLEYINEDGVIRRKNTKELINDLNRETDIVKKYYIQSLINKKTSNIKI